MACDYALAYDGDVALENGNAKLVLDTMRLRKLDKDLEYICENS